MDLINRHRQIRRGSYPVYGRPLSEITTIDDLDKIIRPSDLVHVQQDAKRAIDTNRSASSTTRSSLLREGLFGSNAVVSPSTTAKESPLTCAA